MVMIGFNTCDGTAMCKESKSVSAARKKLTKAYIEITTVCQTLKGLY